MSVCGTSRISRLGWPRQWRGRARRATGAPGFSQGFCQSQAFCQGFFPRLLRGLSGYLNPACRYVKSALEQRLDLLVEFLERGLALDHLAIDEKGRCRVDLQHLAGEFLIGGDLVQQRLVLEAGLDGLLAESGLLA